MQGEGELVEPWNSKTNVAGPIVYFVGSTLVRRVSVTTTSWGSPGPRLSTRIVHVTV